MTARKAPRRAPARRKSGGGWASFWRFLTSLVTLGQQMHAASRSTRSSGQRSGRPAKVPTAMRPPRRTLPGGTQTRGGAKGAPLSGQGLREFRTVEEVWAARGDRKAGGQGGWDPATKSWAGGTAPWAVGRSETDPFMAEMEAKHGVDRMGQPIEGHPRWDTPEGKAELADQMAAHPELVDQGGWYVGTADGQGDGGGAPVTDLSEDTAAKGPGFEDFGPDAWPEAGAV